jgi:hypothetical protein
MGWSRRTFLKRASALPLFSGNVLLPVIAQTTSAGLAGIEVPPILLVHSNGDHAALWITTLWRMESNGVPRERMFAINFTDPFGAQ